MRSRHGSLLSDLRSGGIPDGLADAVESFRAQFEPSDGSHAVDPTSVHSDEMGDAASNKTLATE
jgi:hypothetical protein